MQGNQINICDYRVVENNGNKNKRRAHHTGTNTGTDIVTSNKRMRTRFMILVSCDFLLLLQFHTTHCCMFLNFSPKLSQFDTDYSVIHERNGFSLERCIYIIYMFITEFNEFPNKLTFQNFHQTAIMVKQQLLKSLKTPNKDPYFQIFSNL